jgi:hypothetical protein
MAEDPRDWEVETRLVRGGMARTPYGEISEALFLTQSFAYDTAEAADARFGGEPGFIYQRFGNPTTQIFEDRLALLEGAEVCKSTSSGMSAIHLALTGLLRAGDHLVAGRALFGSCRWIISEWLPRFGVETTYVDATDLEAWKNAVRPNTKAFLVESPANPLLEITAIGAVAEIAHAAGAKLVVDNVFATPIFQKPLALGADIVGLSGNHVNDFGRDGARRSLSWYHDNGIPTYGSGFNVNEACAPLLWEDHGNTFAFIAALALKSSGGSTERTVPAWLGGYHDLHDKTRYKNRSMFSAFKHALRWTGGNVEE